MIVILKSNVELIFVMILLLSGGGVHSNLGCCDTFLKIVSLLENYRSEWGKSIHFGNASLPQVLHVKSYSGLSLESVATHMSSLETYLLPHLLT